VDAMTPLFALGLGALYRKTNKKIGSISTCAASFLCFFFFYILLLSIDCLGCIARGEIFDLFPILALLMRSSFAIM